MNEQEYMLRIAQERATGLHYVRQACDQMARDLGPGVYRRYRAAQDRAYWEHQLALYRQRWICGISINDARAYRILQNVI